MTTMYDSTDLSQLPADDGSFHVGAYTAGWWPTAGAAIARYGRARVLTIAISARYNADCLDIETGDAVPSDAPGWVDRQHAAGVTRPVLYANLSTMPAVQAALAGRPRSSYRLWVAYYTFNPVIPAGFDGCQFSDRALGRNLDQSVCAPDFFAAIPGATSTPAAPPTVQEDDMTTLHREPQHNGGVIAVNAPFVRWLPDEQSVLAVQWRIQYLEHGDPTIDTAPDGFHNAFVWIGPEVGGATPQPANHLSGIVS